jgi:hypothetical protein
MGEHTKAVEQFKNPRNGQTVEAGAHLPLAAVFLSVLLK